LERQIARKVGDLLGPFYNGAPAHIDITLHYIIKLFIEAKVKKTARSTMAQVTQQCQDMTAEISVSSVFDEMTTAMLQ